MSEAARELPKEPVRVAIRILDKDYHIACQAEEKAALLQSAELLNEKMREIRESGKVSGDGGAEPRARGAATVHPRRQPGNGRTSQVDARARRISVATACGSLILV